jgi:hypothetical protein
MAFLFLTVAFGFLIGMPPIFAENGEAAQQEFLQFERVASGEQLNDLVRELVRPASASQLSNWTESSSRSLQLASAWEAARREMSISVKGPDTFGNGRFVGFVEGRLDVAPPTWWVLALREGNLGIDTLYFNKPTCKSPYIESSFRFNAPTRDLVGSVGTKDEQAWVPAMISPVGAFINDEKGGWRVGIGDDFVIVREELRERMGQVHHWACVSFGKDCVYLAFHAGVPCPFKLYCIDRTSGSLKWQTLVWVSGNLFQCTGSHFHWVEIKESANEVVVFGVANEMAYVEGFRRVNGLNSFRFGTLFGAFPPRPKQTPFNLFNTGEPAGTAGSRGDGGADGPEGGGDESR